MPSNPFKDAIVIVFDVGKSVSALREKEDKSFFKKAKGCVSWIIQRKIISQSVDVLSIVLIGSNESTNTYKNISLKFDFQYASWEMLKFVTTNLKSTNVDSNWFKALIYSVDILNAYEEYDNIKNKKIVIFSDFSFPISDDLDIIIKKIEESNVEVTIIGPNHLQFENGSDDDEPENKKRKLEKPVVKQNGEKVVHNLWKKLPENIVICTFESALKQLCSYTPKTKRVNYWNCAMDIGDVHINISMLKKTDPKPSKKFNTKCIKFNRDEASQSCEQVELAATIKDTVMHYKHESGQNHDFVNIEVKPEDTIEGFRYGATVIPFSEEDKNAMEYKAGPKSFSVLGFTRTSNVPYYLLSGECSYLVLPREKDKNAEVALSAIIQGMKKLECIAIVKRVYSNDRGLSLGILYPVTEEIFSDETEDVTFREYLLFVELAFQDDVKSIDFPSLEIFAKDITEKQYKAVDNLIDGMNLMKADIGLRGEPCEAFDLPYLHDIKEQFFHYCVIQKGLYPDKPLPTSIPSYIKNYAEVPTTVAQNCKSLVKDIKKLFKIKKIEKVDDSLNHTKKNSNPTKTIEHFSESVIEEETDAMTRTWMKLFRKSFPSNSELEKLFVKINAEQPDMLKVTESFKLVITQIRAKYSNHVTNPEAFNNWIIAFKKFLDGNTGIFSKLWEVIVNEYVGLIPKEENRYSHITEKESSEFLSADINKPSTSEKEKPNFDMLDELQAEQMNLDASAF